uniref:response regulator n=1 Tax=Zoogloea sp. TaxID=49181 RepID=UPI0035B39101
MSAPPPPARPRVVRSLLWRMLAVFLVSLLLIGAAIQFLIVTPATQALARGRLDLAVSQVHFEAERSIRRVETRLRTIGGWAAGGRLRLDDVPGASAMLVPLLAGDSPIVAIHLVAPDGRLLTVQRETDGWRTRLTDPRRAAPASGWQRWSLDGKPIADKADTRPAPPTATWLDAARALPANDASVGWRPPERLPSGDAGITAFSHHATANGGNWLVACDVQLAELSRLTLETPVGERGGSVVLTDSGEVVALPRFPRFANLADRREALLRPAGQIDVNYLTRGYARWLVAGHGGSETLAYENEGEAWLAQFAPLQLGNQQWWIGGFARENDFIPARLQEVAPVLLLLIGLSLGVSAFIARRLGRCLDSGFAALIAHSERIGRLDLDAAPPVVTPWRELAELAASQETMRRHLRDAADALARSQSDLEAKVVARTRELAENRNALADQLLFIQVLLDVLPNPVFYKGPDARYLGCNRAYEEAFGTTRGFLVGKTVLDLPYLPADLRLAHHEADLHTIATNGTLHKELRLPFADGTEHDTLYWVSAFRLVSGEAGGLLGVLVDISAQKEAEREARRAHEASRHILESSPIAVVINRPGNPPLLANTRAAELACTDMADFMRRPANAWFRSQTVADAVLVQLRDGHPVRDHEVEFRVADGSIIWTLVNIEQLDFRGGPALIAWIYDITRRKAAEQELRKLSLAVEQSPSMLVITNPSGAIQYANPRYCRESGHTAGELAGTRPDLVDAAGQPIDFHADQWHALKAAGVWRRECQLRRRDGDPLWVGISVSGLAENQGEHSGEITHCIWVLEDLSMHRQALATLREAKRLAEEAAESKTRFLANISHEIRTPLNAIIGLAGLCLGSGLDERQRDYLDKIQASGTTLLGVVNDILDFSKIEAGKLQLEHIVFKLDQVLDHVVTFTAQRAQEKGLELLLDIAPDVPQHLVGDPLRLGQVLTNLLGNAAKFTDRGDIRLQVGVAARDAQHATLRFEVRDTGIGMSANQRDRLFEAFSQADTSMSRRFGGTGLGLSIARHLVELMGGGGIDVDSTPGEGSAFRFDARFELAADGAPRVLPGILDGLRVLVVDDHPVARRVLLHLLSNFPFRSEAVSSAAEAITAVHRADGGDRFGLVLMDLRMPLQDGIEATRRIKQNRHLSAPPAVILLTAYGDDQSVARAVDAGIDGCLHKPATASSLLDAIVGAFGMRAAPPLPPPTPDHAHQLEGLRLLVVEDNDINQQIARALLEKRGAQVRIADNGRRALDTLLANGPDAFDLVLMDLQMPEMDGLEATRQIRRDPRFAHLPIVAMTAHALADQRQQCLDIGMNDHVAKPIVPERLFEAILQHTRQPRPPAAASVPDLPGIDVAGALRRVGHDPDAYIRLLRRFAASQRDCAARIADALAAGRP